MFNSCFPEASANVGFVYKFSVIGVGSVDSDGQCTGKCCDILNHQEPLTEIIKNSPASVISTIAPSISPVMHPIRFL